MESNGSKGNSKTNAGGKKAATKKKAGGKNSGSGTAASKKSETNRSTENEVITDSSTQVSMSNLGNTPSVAMGNVIVSTGQALSNNALQASDAQQHASISIQSVTSQGLNTLFSGGSSLVGRVTEELLG